MQLPKQEDMSDFGNFVRVEIFEDTSVDARYVEECTRRLEGSLLQRANVGEVELHIRSYARALEGTKQAIRGLKGGLGVHDERLKGLDAMQQSLGESMATHRKGVDETIIKFESFKTSIT